MPHLEIIKKQATAKSKRAAFATALLRKQCAEEANGGVK